MAEDRIQFNKLVRYGVPAKLASEGLTYSIRELSSEKFTEALRIKLVEEAEEVQKSTTREELVHELADVLEVLITLGAAHDITEEEIQRVRAQQAQNKGVFQKKLFLEWTYNDGYGEK